MFSSLGVHCTGRPCSSVDTRPEMRRVNLENWVSGCPECGGLWRVRGLTGQARIAMHARNREFVVWESETDVSTV